MASLDYVTSLPQITQIKEENCALCGERTLVDFSGLNKEPMYKTTTKKPKQKNNNNETNKEKNNKSNSVLIIGYN